jgi:hypothetical protein
VIYLSAELDIPRKPELVFQVLSDAAAYLAWVEGLVGVEHEGAPTFDEGSSFDVVFTYGKKKISATTYVTRLRPGALLALETRVRDKLVLMDRVELAPSSGGTRLGASSELVEDAGLLRLLARSPGLLGAEEPERGPQKVYARSFRQLKALVEQRTAAPYR